MISYLELAQIFLNIWFLIYPAVDAQNKNICNSKHFFSALEWPVIIAAYLERSGFELIFDPAKSLSQNKREFGRVFGLEMSKKIEFCNAALWLLIRKRGGVRYEFLR